MRIVYMGTPSFAVPSLIKLAEQFEVVGVVTQPDKPKGRGHKLAAPPVKEAAQKLGLPIWQPPKIRNAEFLAQMQDLQPDLILVAAYSKLIPPDLLQLPRLGCVNLHPSLLPRYRGAIPVQAPIMAGEVMTGISTFLMDEGYDTGPLLCQRQVPIEPQESGTELMERLAVLGADLLVETAVGLEAGTLKAVPQSGEANYTKPFKREELIVDWSRSAEEVVNFVRALYREPEAGTVHAGQPLKLGRVLKVEDGWQGEPSGQTRPGQVIGAIKGQGFVVATGGGGAVVLRLVKPAGKGWMDGAAYLAGRNLQIGEQLG